MQNITIVRTENSTVATQTGYDNNPQPAAAVDTGWKRFSLTLLPDGTFEKKSE